MTPAELSAAIRGCLEGAVADGALSVDVPAEVRVERPRQREHGDWATNVALQIAKAAGRPPREVAMLIAERLGEVPGIKSVDVAGPGFLNIVLDAAAAGELARTIVEAGRAYGRSDAAAGQRVNLEFVSANPTGPVHLGGTRWAAVGDSLARILEATGASVTREYYFNDHGTQIDRFARSLLASARGGEVPEDGYAGQYIQDIAADVVRVVTGRGEPDPRQLPDAEAQEVFRAEGVALMFDQIKAQLHDFGVDFDVYFHENSLHESGAVAHAIDRLRELGRIYEADGAIWLRTSDLGDTKDRVVIKSDGDPAYIAGDIAYFRDKRNRGFDLCIYMLGADHHGYIGRLKAAAAALDDDPATVEVLIGQMVNLVSNGKPVRMSKRAGTIVTMNDLVDAVGVDAARYSLIRSSVNATIDIDLDLWSRKTNDNPVFYVQYAHARLSSLTRNAADLGLTVPTAETELDLNLLTHQREGELIRTIGDYPELLHTAAELREPHRIARYLEELASAYHKFYDACRVLPQGDEEATPLTTARLALCGAVRQLLANGLGLLGVDAPERM